jgi:hypothetical protein
MKPTIFLFGEAEKGDYCTPHLCRSLPQLAETFGQPPEDTMGLFYAIQSLLYNKDIVYFRVKEEGFSLQDYKKGLRLLKVKESIPILSAIFIPGIGDHEIIEEVSDVCQVHKSLLVISQKDLYDYLTSFPVSNQDAS